MIKKDKSELKDVSKTIHKPVLLKEVIDIMNLSEGEIFLDGTLGGGGYFKTLCLKVGKSGIGIGLDQDAGAVEKMKEQKFACQTYFVNENYRNMDKVLKDLAIDKADVVVLDLGISSDQLENSGRGFSFKKDEPLLMTLKKDLGKDDLTAQEIVNNWEEENIADILFGYGEERLARRIAKEICKTREEKEISTTFELVEIIKKAVPIWYQFKKTHYATKTFQALRITVNNEIEFLKEGLEKAFSVLNENGRIGVVTFHSLEDRVVKNFFKKKKEEKRGELLTKKPIIPSAEELVENPRSRSAKLRGIKRVESS
ncbi:MAG: 16S rRNA (cytosine(1402)-N(4))-methyltransferase RsmH [Patescibacteria group bacterium]